MFICVLAEVIDTNMYLLVFNITTLYAAPSRLHSARVPVLICCDCSFRNIFILISIGLKWWKND